MPTLVEFVRCSTCGTQQGYLFRCSVCAEWTCNECVHYDVVQPFPFGEVYNACYHEKYEPIPSTGWK